MQKNHFFLGGFRKKCHICIRNPNGGIAQLARAPALQAGGRRFDSDYLHQIANRLPDIWEAIFLVRPAWACSNG